MTEKGQARNAMLAQALSQLQSGNFEDAIEAFSASLLIAPNDDAAFRGRAMARFQLKDWEGAEADFRKAKSLDSSEPENALGVALTLAMKNEIYPSFAEFEALIKENPDFIRGYVQLALLQIRIGAISKGKEILLEGLKHKPQLAERRFIESILAEQQKLDKRRYYRPDFEALNKQKPEN